MDLDEFKEKWKSIDSPGENLSRERIKQIINKESKSPLVKIRKSMRLELLFVILSLVGLYLLFLASDGHTRFSSSLMFGLFLLILLITYILFYVQLSKHITVQFTDESMVTQLTKIIDQLKRDLRIYKWVNLMLYIPAIIIGLTINGVDFVNELNTGQNFRQALHLLGISLVFFPLYYYFVVWYITVLYTKYVDELEQMRDELDFVI